MKIIYGNRFEGGIFIDSCFNVFGYGYLVRYHVTPSEKDKDLFGINRITAHNTNWYYGYMKIKRI